MRFHTDFVRCHTDMDSTHTAVVQLLYSLILMMHCALLAADALCLTLLQQQWHTALVHADAGKLMAQCELLPVT